MRNACQRCGYTWSARSSVPLRCPRCKSTRWNKKVIRDKCMRCGADWIQRGDEQPKYCPFCHSTMWNFEKKVYTCPKCGKTRALRSNSRTGLCPDCDMYVERRQSHSEPLPDTSPGIRRMYHLWGNGKGLALYYMTDNRGIAFLLNGGKYVGEINIESFFRTQGQRFIERDILEGALYDSVFAQAAEKILSSSEPSEQRIEHISTLRRVTETEAKVIDLGESGIPAVAIAMKLGVPYDRVREILSDIPPIRGSFSDTDRYSRQEESRGLRTSDRGWNSPKIKE